MIPELFVAILAIGTINIAECRDLSYSNGELGALAGEQEERKVVCIEVLGCFPETDPEHRPTDTLDKFFAWVGDTIDTTWWRSTREKVGTEFRYWAPNATARPEVMDNFDFHLHITKDSGFDPNLKTFFIIHGYQGGDAPWAVTMKDALKKREDPCHVFIVDWSEGDGLMYGTALANTWVVGAEVGRFIERIVLLTGMKPHKVHIIGHSLGAHTAGFAGKWVKNRTKRKIGRITGLDPAGPDFDDVVPGERLDKNDAAFVDVIHTNWADNALAGLGLQKPIGHFDFYPNGGEDQPGCPTAGQAELEIGQEILEYINPTYNIIVKVVGDDKDIEDAFDDFACSHGRAYDYFIESIEKGGCKFVAVECPSWNDYLANKCRPWSHLTVPMGYDAKKYRGSIDPQTPKTFYLRTNRKSPYCRGVDNPQAA